MKRYTIETRDGRRFTVDNLNEFARRNGHNQATLRTNLWRNQNRAKVRGKYFWCGDLAVIGCEETPGGNQQDPAKNPTWTRRVGPKNRQALRQIKADYEDAIHSYTSVATVSDW